MRPPPDNPLECQAFFAWYNTMHRHSGIGYMTPNSVHYGQAQALFATRQAAFDAAFAAHPNRFKGKSPQPPALPIAAWINPPTKEATAKKQTEPSAGYADHP